jgi:hypothetical protein
MVRQIETQYQTKPMHIPFLGVARFVVGVVRPYGARNFQLAVFENLGPEAGKPIDFEPPGPGWQVVTRVTSLKHPENTLIYARPSGANIKMLIVTTETNEATVVEVEVDPERFARQIQSSIEKHGSENHRDE